MREKNVFLSFTKYFERKTTKERKRMETKEGELFVLSLCLGFYPPSSIVKLRQETEVVPMEWE